MKKKRLNSIILVAIIFIAVASIVLPKELNNLDEIWNFNFAKNVSDGKVPYKDFNIVTTPLVSVICGLILKFVGQELIVTRILAVMLITAILYTVYKILEQLKVNKYYRYIILFIIYGIYMPYFCLDYNFSILLVTLIITLLEIKKVNKTESILKSNFKYDFFVGVLAGTAILFKQSTGLAVAFIYVFYKIIFIKEKAETKETIKIILARTLGVCVPIVLFVIYLLMNNAWTDFLDYAVYGIKTFSNKVPYITLFKNYGIITAVLSIVLPAAIIYSYFKMAIKKEKTKKDIIGTILCAFSAASFVVVYPISDPMHFLVGAMPAIILLIFLTYEPLKKLIRKKQEIYLYVTEFIKILVKLIAVLIIVLSLILLGRYIVKSNNYKNLNHFKYIPTNISTNNIISQYILEKEKEGIKVYVLDAQSAIYTIPIDRYNKNYDMFLKGALGSKGEQGQIENLNQETSVQVLIKYPRNWQTPEEVIEHIQKNWTKTGQIGSFEIYINQ